VILSATKMVKIASFLFTGIATFYHRARFHPIRVTLSPLHQRLKSSNLVSDRIFE